MRQAARLGCPVEPLRRGRVLRAGALELVVLHPPPPGAGRVSGPGAAEADLNNGSLVLLLRHGAVRILFTGDLEAEGERVLMASPLARLAAGCDLLKVAHHGAADGSSAEFLRLVRPRQAVVSVGRHNRSGHPDPRVIRRLAEAGCRKIWRTDRDGAVVVLSDGRQLVGRGLRR